MKKILFFAFAVAALFVCGSCDDKESNEPTPPQDEQPDITDPAIVAATEAVDALIAEHRDFTVDTDEVKHALSSNIYDDAWKLDAQFAYDANFEKMERIVYDFGTPLWEGNNLAVLAFGNTGVSGYNLNDSDHTIEECVKVGYAYDSRDIAITFTTDEGKSFVAKLTALSNDVLVLDGEDGLRTIYKRTESMECLKISATRRIAQLIENTSFDKSLFAEQIVGEWSLNTSVRYNNDWSEVIYPDLVWGEHFAQGLGGATYTFEADGTGRCVYQVADPTIEDTTYTFNWAYNQDSSTLTLTGDINREFTVIGLDAQSLIIDYIQSYTNDDTTHNCREIYVR